MCKKYFNFQKEFGGVPSSSEKSHKFMDNHWGLTWLGITSYLIFTRCRMTLVIDVKVFDVKHIYLKSFQKKICNDLEPFNIHPPFQIKVNNDWNLINKSNIAIVHIILGDMNNSWMEIEHYTNIFLWNVRFQTRQQKQWVRLYPRHEKLTFY